jgi:hypothetical protein
MSSLDHANHELSIVQQQGLLAVLRRTCALLTRRVDVLGQAAFQGLPSKGGGLPWSRPTRKTAIFRRRAYFSKNFRDNFSP